MSGTRERPEWMSSFKGGRRGTTSGSSVMLVAGHFPLLLWSLLWLSRANVRFTSVTETGGSTFDSVRMTSFNASFDNVE